MRNILQSLGHGHYGSVYAAYLQNDFKIKFKVAVKTCEDIEMLLEEACSLVRIPRHPNILFPFGISIRGDLRYPHHEM